MEAGKLIIIRSSAGAGKTFNLAKEYLKLALRSPFYFKRILAVTFTNKATSEMKSRVVDFLSEMQKEPNSLMINILHQETGISKEQIKSKAQAVLSHILHDYAHFNILTIDSFFHQIIKGFSKEIGLSQGIQIEMDTGAVIDQVVDKVFDRIDDDQFLANWVVDYVLGEINAGKRWDIRKKLSALAYEVTKESFTQYQQQIAGLDYAFFKNLKKDLTGIIESYKQKLSSIGKEGSQIIQESGYNHDDFLYGDVPKFFDNLAKEKKLEPNNRLLKNLDSRKWTKEKNVDRDAIENLGESKLRSLLEKSIAIWEQENSKYEAARLIIRQFYNFGLIREVVKGVETYRQENQTMLISDTAPFLKEIIKGSEIPFIYEKYGNFYHHFLIDEFQDTSSMQWENFYPLLSESLASGKENLIVGDIKQSIYRWRGGDWNLLMNGVNKKLRADQIEEKTLDYNWRSTPCVVNFNNKMFKACSSILSSELTDYLKQEGLGKTFEKAYAEVEQQVSPNYKKENGYVEVSLYNTQNTSGKSWQEEVLENIPYLVKDLQHRGYRAKDIAILIRRRVEGEWVVKQLMEHKRSGRSEKDVIYDVISSDSLFIKNSLAVNILLLAMKCINEPLDKISYQALLRHWKEHILEDHHQFQHPQGKKYLALDHILKESAICISLYDLCESLIRSLGIAKLQAEISFLQAFLDLVISFSKDKSANLSAFLDWWEENANKQTIAASENQDAIRIMTIHASKGLEYKAVIIPFCNWALDASFNTILWLKVDSGIFSQAPILPLNYQECLKKTEFADYYGSEKVKSYLDNLNLMYVAFTRAKNELYVMAGMPQKIENKDIKNTDVLLAKVITGGEVPISSVREEENKTTWLTGEKMTHRMKEKPTIFPQEFISKPWGDMLLIKTRGNSAISKINSLHEKKKYGKLVHEILSHVKKISDLDAVLIRYFHLGLLRREEYETLKTRLYKMFNSNQIKECFTANWEVLTETPIIHQGKTHIPDRVLLGKNNNVVIDYKTSDPNDSDYQQVKEYMQAIKSISSKIVSGYLIYLNKESVVKVGEL